MARYMCNLSDADLRLAGSRSMTDLMWTAVKEPLDASCTFDREGLALAYKYFTCSTLTIRITGITQINVSAVALVQTVGWMWVRCGVQAVRVCTLVQALTSRFFFMCFWEVD